jgi:hypothetical protein
MTRAEQSEHLSKRVCIMQAKALKKRCEKHGIDWTLLLYYRDAQKMGEFITAEAGRKLR